MRKLRVKCRLKELMGERTQRWMVKESGVTYPTVNSIYHGRAQALTFEVLGKLARALGVEPGELLSWDR